MIIDTHNWLNQVGLHETAFLFNECGMQWVIKYGEGRALPKFVPRYVHMVE